MKLFMKLMIVALVLAVLAPFSILKDESGRPLMSLSDLKLPDVAVPDVPDVSAVTDKLPGEPGQQTIIYQWTDEAGNLNFTNEPPPEGIEFITKAFDSSVNVIQSIKPKQEAGNIVEGPNGEISIAIEGGADNGIGNPYTPEKIEKLFKDAKDVQKKLNDRFNEQQQALDKL